MKQLPPNIKPLTEEEIKAQEKKNVDVSKALMVNDSELEAELQLFTTIEDPLINPKTGRPMAIVKRPTMSDIQSLAPPELRRYKDVNDIPVEVREKYDYLFFEMMAKLITRPKHDADWWKEHATVELVGLFNKHIEKVLAKLGTTATNF